MSLSVAKWKEYCDKVLSDAIVKESLYSVDHGGSMRELAPEDKTIINIYRSNLGILKTNYENSVPVNIQKIPVKPVTTIRLIEKVPETPPKKLEIVKVTGAPSTPIETVKIIDDIKKELSDDSPSEDLVKV